MRAFVPFFKRRRDVTFPAFAPVSVVTPAMPHSAEEDHFHEAEEQEEEKEGEADRAKRIEVMAIAKGISVRVTVSIPVAVHRRDGCDLPIFCRLFNGNSNFRRLCDSLRDTGIVCHERAASNQPQQEQGSDQSKDETVTKHFYLQW